MLYKKIKYKTSLFIILSVMSISVLADDLTELPSGKYSLDLSHASIVWKVKHLGLSTYVGRFTDFSADLMLDTKTFTNSSVIVEINVDSIATAYPWLEKEDFDKELSEDWFKSGEYPLMVFNSNSTGVLEQGETLIIGNLTILGKTKPVKLTVKLNNALKAHPFTKKPTIGFSATAILDRTLWGLSMYAPAIVGAEVKIEIEGEFEYSE